MKWVGIDTAPGYVAPEPWGRHRGQTPWATSLLEGTAGCTCWKGGSEPRA